jgi:glutamate decarboxylase
MGGERPPLRQQSEGSRSSEAGQLIWTVAPRLLAYLRDAELETARHRLGPLSQHSSTTTSLVDAISLSPHALHEKLEPTLTLPLDGLGANGLDQTLAEVLKYSVNTSAPGFLDKLTSAPSPPAIAAELILAVLNTNLHVYHVSPVLTLIEKFVTKQLADIFGLKGPRRGGISVQGGSASNLTSIAVARNTLYPETKQYGNRIIDGQLLIFASAQGHYSIQKAAEALGFGSNNVISVPVDRDGRMSPSALEDLILAKRQAGNIPFYVSATAGTTVLGSFDPFEEVAKVARTYNMWFHVDASWGGGFVFSQNPENQAKLTGISQADSIAFNAHKMLGVPITCSFLLGNDLEKFHNANSLKAPYLFHDDLDCDVHDAKQQLAQEPEQWVEPDDLADMTLQCGRRGDSLKMFLSWQYYGSRGFATQIDAAFDLTCYFLSIVNSHPHLLPVLSSTVRPACLQACFYFTPFGEFVYGTRSHVGYLESMGVAVEGDRWVKGRSNSVVTACIVKALVTKGFMVDYAPHLEGQEDRGMFFRVVVNISTVRETVDRLLEAIVETGKQWLRKQFPELECQDPGLFLRN